MPGGDRTGPFGMGPMTGRAAGFCAGYPVAGYANFAGGRGMGYGYRGRGRGWRNRYAAGAANWADMGFRFPAGPAADISAEAELDDYKQQAEYLKNTLEQINQRIDQLEKKPE